MRCPWCQFENREEAKFCLNCGKQFEQRCLRCGRLLPLIARFCDECGYDLSPRSYIPKFLANKILTYRKFLEGERKLATVLFADVANFASMFQKWDPEVIQRIMDRCFKLLIQEIHNYEGTISQFTGDGVMALFGVPLAHEDHARRACYAALSIQKALERFAEEVRKEYGLEFKMRIGINSGLVIISSIADDLTMDYTAVGETTVLASRMETMASPGTILVSGDTYKRTANFFVYNPIGKVVVKGKEEPIEAYELVRTAEVQTRIGTSMARGFTRFTGRDRELGSLRQCFENVRSGSGQVIGLMGEAGIGKSRLLFEFKNTLQDAAYTYLEGQCFHFGTSIAYQPFLDILRSYFNVREGMEEPLIKGRIEEMILQTDEKFHSIFSPLYDLFSLTVRDDLYTRLDPKRKREKIFEAIKDILLRESERAPLIIAIEDLQWIDNTSEEFLTYLMGRIVQTQILLILLYRPDYTHPWETQPCYQRIGLDQLSEAARGEVVESLLSGAEISEELSKLIMNRAGGNPLFLEELTYALLESGYIKRGEKGYELSGKVGEIQVPDTIQGIIAARLDRLEENLRRTVQVASVIGKRFALSLLEAVVGAKEEVKAHLLELQNLEFIYETILFPEREYEFKHALVQEVAYNSLLLKRRKEVHEAIGNKIETLYSDRLEEFYEVLAHHYSRGENLQKACKYLKFSGIKAVKNYSLGDALRFYKEAIHTLKKEPLTPDNKKEETDIRLLMASPIISLGFPEDSLEILQEGERLSRELNITKSLTTFCSLLGLYYSVKGEPQTGAKYGEECLTIAEKSGDIELIAPIAFDLCSNYGATGQFSRVIEIAPKVLASIEQEKMEYESFGRGYDVYSALSSFCAFSHGYMGNFEEAKTFFEKAIRVAEKTENLYSLGLAEILYGYVLAHKGDGVEALEHFENSIRYLEKGQIFVLLGLAWTGLGLAYYLKEDLQAARSHMEKGLQLHFDAGISYNASVHYRFLAPVYCDLGELKKAQECAEEALRLAEKNKEIHLLGTTEIIMGRIQGRYGDIQQAEASILHGIKTVDSQGMRTFTAIGYLALGELYALTDRKEKGLKVVKEAQTIFEEKGMDYWLEKAKALLTFMGQSPIKQGGK